MSRAWYCQVLADQIQHVGEQFAAGKIDVGRANRYLLMVLQHLEAARPQRSDNPALVLRGLRLDDHVLLGTKMPAILVETGFLSNPKEERMLTSKAYRNKVINGIAEGVENQAAANQLPIRLENLFA